MKLGLPVSPRWSMLDLPERGNSRNPAISSLQHPFVATSLSLHEFGTYEKQKTLASLDHTAFESEILRDILTG